MNPTKPGSLISSESPSAATQRDTLTVTDNRTGRQFELPIKNDTIRALDLRPIDLRVPDGRELLTERAPGYTLLVWNNGSLAVHSCPAGKFTVAVTYQVPFIKD